MKSTRAQDERFMDEALKLAVKGAGWTNPNPMVGAVIVKNGKIIGKGYHRRAGSAHAEIEALADAGARASGATLYANLEPCSHFGKTPPCVEAIINAGIKRVGCSAIDPNPQVQGHGIARLKQFGISVSVGARSKEARTLNEAFFVFHEKKRPFIALKFAMSLDGKIATRSGDSRWITNAQARKYARSLRRNYQAILIGINTVLRDNPHLGARISGVPDPLRIILDGALKIPLGSKVLRDKNVLIFTTKRSNHKKRKKLTDDGISVVICPGSLISLPFVMKELARREIVSVFVEGGGSVLGSFVDAKLVDKVYAFYAPIIIGGASAISAVGGRGADSIRQSLRLKDTVIKTFGDNILIRGCINHGKVR